MHIIVDNLLTTYYQSGEGRVVVLLHGWGDQAKGLDVISRALDSKFMIIAVDLPGFGGSQPPNKAWRLDDYAKFIAKFLEKIKVQSVYAFVAHSNGGAIAIRGLSKGTLSSGRLVLLASSGIRNQYKGRNKALRVIAKTGKLIATPLPASVKSKLRSSMYKRIGSDMLVAEHLQETFKGIITDDVQADAATLTLPTLLIYGTKDLSTPMRYGELFNKLILGSKLKLIESAGHFVYLDKPQAVINSVKEFLG